MGELKVKIPDELAKTMQEFSLDWSEVARRALIDKAEKLKRLKGFSSKFKLSEKDAVGLSDKMDEAVSGKFLKEAR